MGMWLIAEPAPRHVLLRRLPIRLTQGQHRRGLDVECGMGKRALAGEAHEVPVNEHEVIRHGIADEYRLSGDGPEPLDIPSHRRDRFFAVRTSCFPRLPPGEPPLRP